MPRYDWERRNTGADWYGGDVIYDLDLDGAYAYVVINIMPDDGRKRAGETVLKFASQPGGYYGDRTFSFYKELPDTPVDGSMNASEDDIESTLSAADDMMDELTWLVNNGIWIADSAYTWDGAYISPDDIVASAEMEVTGNRLRDIGSDGNAGEAVVFRTEHAGWDKSRGHAYKLAATGPAVDDGYVLLAGEVFRSPEEAIERFDETYGQGTSSMEWDMR